MLDESWLPTLNTNTPQKGFELAVKLSRLAVMVSQSCDDNRQGGVPCDQMMLGSSSEQRT